MSPDNPQDQTVPPEPRAVRVVISGRVQGVGFRAWTTETAQMLGLYGFVRNRLDGSVEALFSGPRQKVEEMVHKCHSGPAIARVDDVKVASAKGVVPNRFQQKPTV